MKDLRYSVREFQARLGEALRAARRGERVRIVSRGGPDVLLTVARGGADRMTAFERKLDRLVRQGRLLREVQGRIRPFKGFPGSGLVAQVLSDRR
jgi:prevent-host-death family protein